MKFFGKFLSLLLLFSGSGLQGQIQTGLITGFGWEQGVHGLLDAVQINMLTCTGPMDVMYFDIMVSGLDIYGEPVGDGVNGEGELGYIIATGYTAPLRGPLPMTEPETGTMGPWFWLIPNEGRHHNMLPGYFLTFNFYSENPLIDPNAVLLRSMGSGNVFVDVECDLFLNNLSFSTGTYDGGDFITLEATYSNGVSGLGGTPVLESRPIDPDIGYRIDFRLTIDPFYEDAPPVLDDFGLHSVTIFGDGRNAQLPRDLWWDPGESVTITTDALLPRNYPGIYYLGAELNSTDSPLIADINQLNDVIVSSDTARIYLRPTNSPSTFPVSEVTDLNGSQVSSSNEFSDFPSISGDGGRIAFLSRASNLVPGDSNGLIDVFVRHRDTGRIQLVSSNSNGEQANRNSESPAISADGSYVAFSSTSTNLVDGDTAGFNDVFVHNVETGETIRISKRIETVGDITYVLEPDGSSFTPSISEDGRFVAFTSYARNLDPNFDGLFPAGGLPVPHIYVHDRCLDGDVNRIDSEDNVYTYLVSVSSSGSFELADSESHSPALSLDGQWIAFVSKSTNLQVEGFEANGFQQVFRRRLFDDVRVYPEPDGFFGYDDHLQQNPFYKFGSSLEIVSVDAESKPGNSDSFDPKLDGDGDQVIFVSQADHFDSRMVDANNVPDIFIRSFQGDQPKTVRVSISSGGNEALDVNGSSNLAAGSLSPGISGDGRFVTFRSHADNITHLSPLTNGFSDVFLHNRDFDGNGVFDEVELSGVLTEVVSVNRFGYATSATTADPSASSRNPTISANGRFVAYSTDSENSGGLRFARTNLFPLDNNNFRDIFMYDQNTNVSPDLPERYPPYIEILAPSNNSQFATGSTFFVRAYATDVRGTTEDRAGIERVEFIVNGEVVAQDFTVPYSTVYSPRDEGSYSIRARAIDLDGYVTFSDPVLVNAVISPARLPEVNLPYPRNGQAFPPNQDVPLLAEILGDPNISGATFQSLEFFVDGEQAAAGLLQPDGLYQSIHRFLTPGKHKINAVLQYQLNAGGGGITIQAISNTVTINIVNETGSLAPTVQLVYPPDRATITSSSGVRLLATAADPDGNLIGVQFYVNGVAYGNEVLRTPSSSPDQFPFGIHWSPDSPGSYEITCVARDSSGNNITSFPVRISTTTGVNPPFVQLTQPFTPPEAYVRVLDGEIDSINLIQDKEGRGFFKSPDVIINGLHHVAEADVTIDSNGGIQRVYFPEDPVDPTTPRDPNEPSQSKGRGYERAPSVTIAGDGSGAKAFARIKETPWGNVVDQVIVRSPGSGYSTAKVIFSGGHLAPSATVEDLDDGSIRSIKIEEVGSGLLSGSITQINIINGGSGYVMTDPPEVIISDPADWRNGDTAKASAEVNFEGQVQAIHVDYMGSGYDKLQEYTGTLKFSEFSNLLGIQNIANSSFEKDFLEELVVGGDLFGGEILYDKLRVEGSKSNDGEFTIVDVSSLGLELFPNLTEEAEDYEIRLTAFPAPPTVTIIPFERGVEQGFGSGAMAESFVANPTVTFREVRTIQDEPTGQSNSAILLSAEATDEGVVTNIEFYANGVLVPSALPTSAYWTPTAAGIYEVVAIATDDDGNTSASTPVEFRITEPEPSAAFISLIGPVAESMADSLSFATGSSIDLTAWASVPSGSITRVDFYANGVLVGTDVTPMGTTDNGHYTITWSPAAPGDYTITAYATDILGQVVGLDSPQKINVTRSSGSRAPLINLVYPPPSQTTTTVTDPTTGEITTVTNDNPTYITDRSQVRLSAVSNDPDGDLLRVRFYVNGSEVDAITGFLKFRSQLPSDADQLRINDGINSVVFEFNSFGGISPDAVEVTVVESVTDAFDAISLISNADPNLTSTDVLGTEIDEVIQYLVNEINANSASLHIPSIASVVSELSRIEGELTLVTKLVDNDAEPATIIEILSKLRDTINVVLDIAATRENLINSIQLRTTIGMLDIHAYPVGNSGIFFEHLNPSGIYTHETDPVTGAVTHLLPIEVSSSNNSFWSRGFFNGVVRYPTSNPEDHPFSVQWSPGISNGSGIYTVSAVAEDSSGNKSMSSSVSISSTIASRTPDSMPTVTLRKIAENNIVSIPPNTNQSTTTQTGGGAIGTPGGQVTTNTAAWATIYVDEINDTDGEITQVEFFVNGRSIGIDYEAYYQMRWTPTSPGFYEVHATARDDRGNIAVTDVEKILVAYQGSVQNSSVNTGIGNGPLVQITYPKRTEKLDTSAPDAVVDISSPLEITVHAEPRDSDPFSLVQRVEVYVNLDRTPIGTLTSFPYNLSYNPTSLGYYEIKAIAYDIHENASESESVVIEVVDQSNTGSFDIIDDDKPFVEIQSPRDGDSVFVGQDIEMFVYAAPSKNNPTHTINHVDFFANNVFIDTVRDYPYLLEITASPDIPDTFGDFVLTAVAYDEKGVTNTSEPVTIHVIQDPLRRPTTALRPFDNSYESIVDEDLRLEAMRRYHGDFVLAVHRDLVWFNPTRGEYDEMIDELIQGSLTRESLTERLMSGSFYSSVRDLSMAHFLLRQSWPSHRESLVNLSIRENGVAFAPHPVTQIEVFYPDPVYDTMTSTRVGLFDRGILNPLAPALLQRPVQDQRERPMRIVGLEAVVQFHKLTGFDLLHGNFSEKENAAFFDLLFPNKYGVAPTPLQSVRGLKQINAIFVDQLQGVVDISKLPPPNNNNQNILDPDENLRRLDQARRTFLTRFVRDNEFVEAGGLTYTEDIKIAFPPNNRLPELADANTLRTAIMRSDGASLQRNLDMLALGDLSAQISHAINSQEFKNRFSSESSDDSSYTTIRAKNSNSSWAGAQMVADGWMNLEWFGFFYHGNAPWVFHRDLGWLYNTTGNPDDLWLWHDGLGWCWTNSEQYPHLYSADHGWVYYQTGTSDPSYFYDYDDSQWRTH